LSGGDLVADKTGVLVVPDCVGLVPIPGLVQFRHDALAAISSGWEPGPNGPGESGIELDRIQAEYNSVRLHAAIGYVTPTTSTTAAAKRSARPAATGSPRRGSTASHTVGTPA
jgi:hypothetical protein